jgi:hypothetical protein
LEKVQCKYTTSNGRVIVASVRSSSAWVNYRYTASDVDWMAVFDATSSRCFCVPSAVWNGQIAVSLRLVPTINGQAKGIRFAKDFERLAGNPHDVPSGPADRVPLPLGLPPE